jgi:hypothetical protein
MGQSDMEVVVASTTARGRQRFVRKRVICAPGKGPPWDRETARSAPLSNHVAMDRGYYENLQGKLRGLLIDLEDRLTPQTCAFVDEFIDHSECGLALETMAEMLSEAASPITSDERDRMLELATEMGMNDRVPGHLALCPVHP